MTMPSMKTTFYWSLGGHAVLLLLLILISFIASCSRPRTPEQVHVFRLQAGPPAPRTEVTAPAEVTPTPPAPRVESQQPSTPKPQEQPKPKPQEQPKPTERKPDPKPTTQRNPVRYDDFIRTHDLPESKPKPPATTPTPPAPDPNAKLREELEAIIQGLGGTDASSDELQELNRYVSQLRAQLNRLWMQPTGLPSGQWSALIEFTIEPNGRVTAVRFREESGNAQFDQSLIRAMNAFRTTAPPPDGKARVFAIPFRMTVH